MNVAGFDDGFEGADFMVGERLYDSKHLSILLLLQSRRAESFENLAAAECALPSFARRRGHYILS